MGALYRLSCALDALNLAVGRLVTGLALVMVLVQFLVVVLRYVYGLGFIWLQESVLYMHAVIFMVGAGYTLLMDGHVRVDIFYREASRRRKALIDLLGTVFFLFPFCILVLYVSWPYVANAWAVHEGSKETSGIPGIYLLKTSILIFAGLLIVQGVSKGARALLTLLGLDTAFGPRREHHA
ncbi:TRAP transporter small permease subunit [Pararhodospirillum photometricum]|uniref:TRAP transporter small permease subunit n=1 Tax=Pararhodospirillum photometricum TaxID=1084 RepID=UPI000306EF75|nr:TRAP transporter small permease subunit [Pararhodospirillum photometricum]